MMSMFIVYDLIFYSSCILAMLVVQELLSYLFRGKFATQICLGKDIGLILYKLSFIVFMIK